MLSLHPFVAGAYSSTYHPDWSVLAARIVVSDLHKQTSASFVETATKLRNYKHPKTGKASPLLAEDVYDIIVANAAALEAAIDYTRDFECVTSQRAPARLPGPSPPAPSRPSPPQL